MEFQVGKYKCIVDDEDYDWLKDCTLGIHYGGYRKNLPYICVGWAPIHRLIFAFKGEKVQEGNVIDHINRNSCDNRRDNLRQITSYENIALNKRVKKKGNYIGVYYRRTHKCWVATYSNGIVSEYVGQFPTAKEAAIAHDMYAITKFRNPLRLNFPDEFYKLKDLFGKKD